MITFAEVISQRCRRLCSMR